jgi:uncharacterized protein YbjT (DUF2867 family)
MKSILVLGGTGFVGTQVCEKLAQQGLCVVLPTRRSSNARHLQHFPGLTVLEMDVHDEPALRQAAAGQDAIVNLIAILHGDTAAFDKAHVVLPQKLARVCQAQAIGKLVHVSALGVNDAQPGAAPSEYLRSKGRGEAVLQRAAAESAMELTILRPSVIFGAKDQFLNLFARLQSVFPVMPLAGANARFQPVWVDDVATAIVRSLERSINSPSGAPALRILEAVGPDTYTLKELVQMAAQLSSINHGRGRPVIALPDWMGRLQALLMEKAPGPTLMSRDNLDSMKVDNVATGTLPGLEALGITPARLEPIAREYLRKTPRA